MAGSSRRVFERSLFAGTRAGTQRMMEWPRFGNNMLVYFAYYASIMLDAFACLLCFKLCRHNRPGPNWLYK